MGGYLTMGKNNMIDVRNVQHGISTSLSAAAITGVGVAGSMFYSVGSAMVSAGAFHSIFGATFAAIALPDAGIVSGLCIGATAAWAYYHGGKKFCEMIDTSGLTVAVSAKNTSDESANIAKLATMQNNSLLIVPAENSEKSYRLFYKFNESYYAEWSISRTSDPELYRDISNERSASEFSIKLAKELVTSNKSAVLRYHKKQCLVRSTKHSLKAALPILALVVGVLALTACPLTSAFGIAAGCVLAAYIAGGIYGAKTYKAEAPKQSNSAALFSCKKGNGKPGKPTISTVEQYGDVEVSHYS